MKTYTSDSPERTLSLHKCAGLSKPVSVRIRHKTNLMRVAAKTEIILVQISLLIQKVSKCIVKNQELVWSHIPSDGLPEQFYFSERTRGCSQRER